MVNYGMIYDTLNPTSIRIVEKHSRSAPRNGNVGRDRDNSQRTETPEQNYDSKNKGKQI